MRRGLGRVDLLDKRAETDKNSREEHDSMTSTGRKARDV